VGEARTAASGAGAGDASPLRAFRPAAGSAVPAGPPYGPPCGRHGWRWGLSPSSACSTGPGWPLTYGPALHFADTTGVARILHCWLRILVTIV